MILKKFNDFRLNEDLEGPQDINLEQPQGDVTLYRLTSHSVVDLNDPGEFYVSSQDAVDPKLLDKPGTDLFLITITTDSTNIDSEKSKQESQKLGNESVVAVKDSTKCEVINIVPFKR